MTHFFTVAVLSELSVTQNESVCQSELEQVSCDYKLAKTLTVQAQDDSLGQALK